MLKQTIVFLNLFLIIPPKTCVKRNGKKQNAQSSRCSLNLWLISGSSRASPRPASRAGLSLGRNYKKISERAPTPNFGVGASEMTSPNPASLKGRGFRVAWHTLPWAERATARVGWRATA